MTAIRDTAEESGLSNPNPESRHDIAAALMDSGIAGQIKLRFVLVRKIVVLVMSVV